MLCEMNKNEINKSLSISLLMLNLELNISYSVVLYLECVLYV